MLACIFLTVRVDPLSCLELCSPVIKKIHAVGGLRLDGQHMRNDRNLSIQQVMVIAYHSKKIT